MALTLALLVWIVWALAMLARTDCKMLNSDSARRTSVRHRAHEI
jgi:hypothetical protein